MRSVRRLVLALALSTALATPAGATAIGDLSFSWSTEAKTDCKSVWSVLTEFEKLRRLIPHLNAKSAVGVARQVGDAMIFETPRPDGTKSTAKMLVTSIDRPNRLQVLIEPGLGPWLRVQEFQLIGGGSAEAPQCHIKYQESYNPFVLEKIGYTRENFIKELRIPYMKIILSRLRNLAEGKEAGPEGQVDELRNAAGRLP